MSTTSTRCSSTRGPATAPSLVTWPTSTVGDAACSWRRAAAGRRPRAPARPSRARSRASSAQSVCTESTTQTSGCSALERRADEVEVGLGEHAIGLGAAEPLGAQPHLRGRLLAGHEQHAVAVAREPRRAPSSVSVDLPTPGSPPSSTSEPGTSPPPSTRSNSGMPVEIRADSSATHRVRSGPASASGRRPLGRRAVELLDEASEGAAARALAEPATRGRAALGARELDSDLRHGRSV